MTSAVLTRPKTIQLQTVPLPGIKEDEVKIKVQGCGVCSSSIPLWEGREWFSYPCEPGSPGHEGWGIVDHVGDRIEGINIGDRVAFFRSMPMPNMMLRARVHLLSYPLL